MISLVMLKWVLGMANGIWVLLQHPCTHVFGIPFPPSTYAFQALLSTPKKPPQ